VTFDNVGPSYLVQAAAGRLWLALVVDNGRNIRKGAGGGYDSLVQVQLAKFLPLLIATGLHAEQGICYGHYGERSVQSFTAKRKVIAAAAKVFPQFFFSVKKLSMNQSSLALLDPVLQARAVVCVCWSCCSIKCSLQQRGRTECSWPPGRSPIAIACKTARDKDL